MKSSNYAGREFLEQESFRIRTFNKVITPLRIMLKRIEMEKNPSDRFDEFVPKIWEGYSINSVTDNEATSTYGYRGTYFHQSDIEALDGAFVYKIPL
jgi:hypothetical protein